MTAIVSYFYPSPAKPVDYKRPEPNDPLVNKVKRGAAFFFLTLAYVVFFPVAISAAAYRLYVHFDIKKASNSLGKRGYASVRKFVHETKSPLGTRFNVKERNHLEGAEKEKERFVKAVLEVSSLLEKEEIPEKGAHAHMQKIREKIDFALSLPIYQKNKDKRENCFIHFLHTAAHALTAEAEGMEEYRVVGKKAAGAMDNPTFAGLAERLDQTVENQKSFKMDTFGEKVFWTFAHPQRAMSAMFDGLGWTGPIAYNSYQYGNANIRVGTFHVGNEKMHLALGPTPTCDRLFTAHLEFIRNRGGNRLQQDLEYLHKAGEKGRIVEKKKIASAYQDTMVYLSCPLDGKLWKSKEKDFFSEVRGELGKEFHLPEELKQDAEKLIEVTSKALQGVEGHNKAKLLAFETALAVAAIVKTAKGDSYMGQACKQDIDRGVVLNAMTLLFFDALGDKPITEDRIHQIIGIVLMRAGMVDHRSILKDRYEALSDLLHIIAKDPKVFFQPFKEHFHRRDIRFAAENDHPVQSDSWFPSMKTLLHYLPILSLA